MRNITFEGQQQPVVRADAPAANEGYLVSSLDLKAGLWVREVFASALPHDEVSELARMRRAWPVPKLVAFA